MSGWMQSAVVGMGAVAATAAATYSYASLVARHRLVVKRVRIPVATLPPALHGCKIVHMSDFHHVRGASCALAERAVGLANALRPDLIALTGDFVTQDPQAVAELIPILANLRAPMGVFAVLGNHDFNQAEAMLRSSLPQAGIYLLVNAGVTVPRGSARLFVAGVDDCSRGKPDLDKALASMKGGQETAVLLLAHQPDFADRFAQDERVMLQLSGHSHGGQVRLPGVGPLILPWYGKKYHTGLYRVKGMWLYTNRGIGVNGLPVRFNCPPEVTEITLCKIA